MQTISPPKFNIFSSIFAKVLLLLAVISTILVAAVSYNSYVKNSQMTGAVIADLASASTRNAARAVRRVGSDPDAITNVVAEIKADSDGLIDAILVLDAAGEILKESPDMTPTDRSTLMALANEALRSGERLLPDAELDLAVPIFSSDREIIGAVAADWSSAIVQANIRAAMLGDLLIAFGVLSLTLVGSFFFLRRIMGTPLAELESSVQAVTDGNYSARVKGTDRSDEFGRLANNLEIMRAGLAESSERNAEAAKKREEQRALITALRSALEDLSKGNLMVALTGDFPESYAELVKDFNKATGSFHDAVSEVITLSDKISDESNEIGSYAADLSKRTENQAATLEETAAALDDLTNGVRNAADSTKEIAGVVQQAQKEATQSGEVVQKTISAMSEISDSSNQISDIISVIDDIAFQTNLLALNAGVEAARAGDAGRGFAVVASEVRALAQRSSEAAHEIKTLIGSSSEHVASGVSLVAQTGEALTGITDRVVHISTLITDMASNAQEQAASLDEINVGVGQLDQVTQRNASMVEESNSATKSLLAQAEALTHLVGDFTIRGQSQSSPLVLQDRVA